MDIEAYLFDMDGVILNSMPMHIRVWKEVLADYGLAFDDLMLTRFNGMSSYAISKTLIAEHGLDVQPELLVQEKNELEEKYGDEMLDLFGDVDVTLDTLRERGFLLALATSSRKEFLDFVDSRFALSQKFEVVVHSGMVKHAKPDPEIFQKAAELLGVAPIRCAVIDDSKNGIIAANRAGMYSIAITNTSPEEVFTQAKRIIQKISELP